MEIKDYLIGMSPGECYPVCCLDAVLFREKGDLQVMMNCLLCAAEKRDRKECGEKNRDTIESSHRIISVFFL